MPVYTNISPLNRLVVIVARGDVTAEEIAAAQAELVAASVSSFAKIIDITAARTDLTADRIERIAALFRANTDGNTRGALAFVVDPERADFANAFANFTRTDRPIQLFRSLHVARKWLIEGSSGSRSAPPSVSIVKGIPIGG